MLEALGHFFVSLRPQHKAATSLELFGPVCVVRFEIVCVSHHALGSNDVLEYAQILKKVNLLVRLKVCYLHQR